MRRGWGSLGLALTALCLLHNDLWWWTELRSIGGWPASLLYHLAYCGVASIAMAALVRRRWPRT